MRVNRACLDLYDQRCTLLDDNYSHLLNQQSLIIIIIYHHEKPHSAFLEKITLSHSKIHFLSVTV